MVDSQPYVHVGMYSEGEFAVSPTIVQLAAQRKLPLSGDWDTAMLGQDEGKDFLLIIPPTYITVGYFLECMGCRIVGKYVLLYTIPHIRFTFTVSFFACPA